MTLASDYYKAGISIAPNVEPLLYDTIWTERYMGLIEENPEGYKNASVLTHVDKAKGHLLQIHGNADYVLRSGILPDQELDHYDDLDKNIDYIRSQYIISSIFKFRLLP